MESKIVLSIDQQAIFSKITQDNKNIFFTGCAGTGKSYLIKYIIQYYKNKFSNNEELVVTASTGRAAFGIGGITLHSFAGIGLGKEDITKLINRAMFNKKVFKRWITVKVLIIDEVSMLDPSYFDVLDRIAKSTRKCTKPFGGIQLILTGDLLQLPPVSESGSSRNKVFQAESWKACIDEYLLLYKVYRQSDAEFRDVLTYIRLGIVNGKVLKFMEILSKNKDADCETSPVNLYATKARADVHNKQSLDTINQDIVVYKAVDRYKTKDRASINLLNNCPAIESLHIKIGAQVMLVKNISRDLVNGTVGIVINFTDTAADAKDKRPTTSIESLPIVRFTLINGKMFTKMIGRETWSQSLPTGESVASRTQLPLILAWAVTIHKSQGQTIERLKVDLSDIFMPGQVYTALSRAVSPNNLQVTGFDANKVVVDQESVAFCIKNGLM